MNGKIKLKAYKFEVNLKKTNGHHINTIHQLFIIVTFLSD